MKTLINHRDLNYYLIETSGEMDKFQLADFRFFKGMGIVDYQQTFKSWLRKFPRPVFIVATHNNRILSWMHIDMWPEGKAKDGNPVYVLRAIETSPELRRRQIGKVLVYLGLKYTNGYMLTKPVTEKARQFFTRLGFEKPSSEAASQLDISKYSNHLVISPQGKRAVIQSVEEGLLSRTDSIDTALDRSGAAVHEEARKAPAEAVELAPPARLDIQPEHERLDGQPSRKVLFFFDTSHELHKSATFSPENPKRITNILEKMIERKSLVSEFVVTRGDIPAATELDLVRVHKPHYIEFIKNYCQKGGGFLGEDTYLTLDTYFVATVAAGAGIQAAKEVLAGSAPFAFACVRPPGHHAKSDKHGGYCIFNNAAVLARYLQAICGLQRILIIDWDAHAANGTMEIFYNDPTVALISIHQDPHDFYPYEGLGRQLGKGSGLGSKINIEMPKASGDAEYAIVFNEIVLPVLKQFEPDFVIGCCGFDAHHSDEYTDLQMTSAGFHNIARMLGSRLPGRLVVLLEGGYTKDLGDLAISFLEGLAGRDNHFMESFDALSSQTVQQEKSRKVLEAKLRDLKMVLRDHYRL